MSDSIQTAIRVIEKTSSDSIELINKVDSFYNSAWDKLIMMGTVAFAIVGIVVPLIIQWYQKKTLKISEELLKKEIENQVLKIKQEILVDISKILETKLQTFEEKIEKLSSSANAKTFHVQGNTYHDTNKISDAYSCYVTAAICYFACNDFPNLQITIKNINLCLNSLTLEDLANIKISDNCDIEDLIKSLSKNNKEGLYTTMINDLRIKLNKLPKTLNGKQQAIASS